MSPEEDIGKFVSFELMIKGSKQIIKRGGTSTPEVQPVDILCMGMEQVDVNQQKYMLFKLEKGKIASKPD